MKAEFAQRSNVLIIEDQSLAQNFLKTGLEAYGFRSIKTAASAKSALKLCSEMKFQVIICSFNLSRDRDGFHLFEEMKSKGYISLNTAFIFVSAETSMALVNSVIELQPDDFLVKPFTVAEIKQRLDRVLSRKEKLSGVYAAIENKKYRKAINLIDNHLQNSKLAKLAPFLIRIKGDALLALDANAEAEEYYGKILENYKFAWASVGLAQALLGQKKEAEAKDIIMKLVERPESRLAALDLLGQYHINNDDYEEAYKNFHQASELSPRNISRQKNVLSIARLIHDHSAQFEAAKSMAKNAKRSIHDSPDLYITVARAGIDYALTLTEDESAPILRQAEKYIEDVQRDFSNSILAQEKINVVQARVHYLKDEQEQAQQLIKTVLNSHSGSQNIEDDIDKAKAYHELGHKDAALEILENIGEASIDDPITYKVMQEYLKQEVKERTEIPFSPRQLNNMAVEFYNRKQLEPAIQTFADALRLMPKNARIALNFLQVLVDQKQKYGLSNIHHQFYDQCLGILSSVKLSDTQARRYDLLLNKASHSSIDDQA